MKYIGIINCFKTSHKCTSSGCFKAFYAKEGSFERYEGEEIQMRSFTHCKGCSSDSVENVVSIAKKMKERGVDVVHLSSCVRSKCPSHQQYIDEISEFMEIEAYSHAKGKKIKPSMDK